MIEPTHQVIAHVIEEHIEGFDGEDETGEMHIVMDEHGNERPHQVQYIEEDEGEYPPGTMEVLVSQKGSRRGSKKMSRSMQVVTSSASSAPPQQAHTVQQPPPRSYMEEEHLSRRHHKYEENQIALPGHRYHEESQLQVEVYTNNSLLSSILYCESYLSFIF